MSLATLRSLAAKATGGPWRFDGNDIDQLTDSGQGFPLNVYPDSRTVASGKCQECGCRLVGIARDEDAAYLAALDPQTVTRLLDVVELAAEIVEASESVPADTAHAAQAIANVRRMVTAMGKLRQAIDALAAAEKEG